MKTVTFYSQSDLAASIKEAKEAFATQFVDLGHMDQSETDFVAAYLFEKQGADVTPPAVRVSGMPEAGYDNIPEELVKAMNTVQKYATAVTIDGQGPIFSL